MDTTYNNIASRSKLTLKINLGFYFMFSVFFLNENVRGIITSKLVGANILFFIVSSILIIRSIKTASVRPLVFFISIMFSCFALISIPYFNEPISYFALTITNLVTPLLLLSVKITKENALNSLKMFLKYFNALIIALVLIGIVDYLTNSSIQLLMADTIFKGTQFRTLVHTENNWGIYRYYSFIGHPIQTSFYLLVFFSMNRIYSKYDKGLIPVLWLSIITLCGLFLCGSKTAFIIGLTSVIFFSGLRKYKVMYFATIFLSLFILLQTPLFQENLKLRYLQGINTGDLSSGRNALIQQLLNEGGELPKIFLGGGVNYSRFVAKSIDGLIYNFEYPTIMLSYDYGIISMLLIYICVFFYPVITLLRKKKFFILSLFLFLSLMLNTYNGLANLDSGVFSQLCVIIFILMNLENGKEDVHPGSLSSR